MGRSYTSRNSNSKAVHTHHEVTVSRKYQESIKKYQEKIQFIIII